MDILNIAKNYAGQMGGMQHVPQVPAAKLNINGIGTLEIPMGHPGPTAQPPAGMPLPQVPGMSPEQAAPEMAPDQAAPEAEQPPIDTTPDYEGVSGMLQQLGIDDATISRARDEHLAGSVA
jgi:hypothetical protein